MIAAFLCEAFVTPITSALQEKSVTLWDLDDAQSWSLEVSRIRSRK